MDALIFALTVLTWALAIHSVTLVVMLTAYLAAATRLADAKHLSEKRLH